MLSILMPVHNERERIECAVEAALSLELSTEFELIVVDDCSTDGTRAILRAGDWNGRFRSYEHDISQGRGAAVRTALTHARGEYATIFDPDLEYDAADLGLLVEPLLDSRATASFGRHSFDRYAPRPGVSDKFMTLVCNVLFNTRLPGIMTSQKVVRTEILRGLSLRSPGFALEFEIAAGLLQRRETILEVPVRGPARATGDAEKPTGGDTLRVLAMLVRRRLSVA